MKLTLDLPWPPSVNHYKRGGSVVRTKSGQLYQQRVNTNETKQFYFDVYIIAKNAINSGENLWKKSLLDNEYFAIKIYASPPDKKKRDIDNILKVLLDSLVRASVIEDDSFIRKLYVEKIAPEKGGKVRVELEKCST